MQLSCSPSTAIFVLNSHVTPTNMFISHKVQSLPSSLKAYIFHFKWHARTYRKTKAKPTPPSPSPKPGNGVHLLAKTSNTRGLYSISVLVSLTLYFGKCLIHPTLKVLTYRCHLHEVRSEAMDNCTQCKATFPGGSQVCNVNITVPFCLFLTPGQKLVRSNIRLCSYSGEQKHFNQFLYA